MPAVLRSLHETLAFPNAKRSGKHSVCGAVAGKSRERGVGGQGHDVMRRSFLLFVADGTRVVDGGLYYSSPDWTRLFKR